MPIAPSEQRADLALLFDFDGVLYVGDLPILAYARHCAELLSDDAATALIDGIRFFLEGKSFGDHPVGPVDAEDGYQAVEMLAAAAGLTSHQVHDAYGRSRADLAGSAFALEVPDGLVELLQDIRPARILAACNADPVGVHEALDALGLSRHLDAVITKAGKPDSLPAILDATLRRIGSVDRPDRLMVVGDRWSTDLATAHALGATTAMIDRFGRGAGSPALRASDMAALVPRIRDWALACRAAG